MSWLALQLRVKFGKGGKYGKCVEEIYPIFHGISLGQSYAVKHQKFGTVHLCRKTISFYIIKMLMSLNMPVKI